MLGHLAADEGAPSLTAAVRNALYYLGHDTRFELAHITGGGITENLNRALNDVVDAVVDLGSWPVPPIVRYTCEAARLSEPEALKTFNMGLGLVLIVDPARVEEVRAAAEEAGEKTFVVGRIEAGSGIVRYNNEGTLL